MNKKKNTGSDGVLITITESDNRSESIIVPLASFRYMANTCRHITGDKKAEDIDIVIKVLLRYFSSIVEVSNLSITKSKDDAKDVKLPKKKSPFTEDDHIVVALWREIYRVPDNVRLFYPAIKKCLTNLRKTLSQEDILRAVKVSETNSLVQKFGNPPPLSSILSEKMISHLVLQSEMQTKKTDYPDILNYMNYMLFTQAANVPVEKLDSYVDAIKNCKTKEEMQLIYKGYMDEC